MFDSAFLILSLCAQCIYISNWFSQTLTTRVTIWLVKKAPLLSIHICKVYCLYRYIYSIEIYVGLHFSRKFLLIRHLVNLLLPRLPRAAKRLLTSRSPPFTPQVSRLTILNSKLPTRRKHWMFLSFDFHRFYLPGITLHLPGSQEIYLQEWGGEKAAQIYWNLVSRPP